MIYSKEGNIYINSGLSGLAKALNCEHTIL